MTDQNKPIDPNDPNAPKPAAPGQAPNPTPDRPTSR